MRYTVVQTFKTKAVASMPDPEKPSVFRKLEFTCEFQSHSNDPTVRDELQKRQREDGAFAFLDSQLKGVQFVGEHEFEDVDGSLIEPLDFVKKNQICASAAILAFWDVINRDVEAKNSKKSR